MPLRRLLRGTAYEVFAYARSDADCQVATYLEQLGDRNRKRVTALLERAANHGPPRNQEKSRKVAGEHFWEFKAHQQRIFWCYAIERRIVLLYGFSKKTTQTPSRHVEAGRLAYRQARREILRGNND